MPRGFSCLLLNGLDNAKIAGRSSKLLRWVMVSIFLISALVDYSPSANAASCSLPNDPDYGPNTGFQYVAQACPVADKFIYNRYDLNCNQSSSVDGINESIGSTPRTPDEMQTALINYFNAVYPDGSPNEYYKKSLKMFKNSTGSSFVFVVGSYSKYNLSSTNLRLSSWYDIL